MSRKKFTLDDNSTPSNPANIRLKPFVWVKYDLVNVLSYFLPLVFSVLLCVVHSYYWLVVAIPILLLNGYYWLNVVEHYRADSNLGIVISIDPPLLAVYTDLSKGVGSFPAIKIIDFKVKEKLQLGTEVGTVAIYRSEDEDSFLNSDDELNYWVNFYPLPIDYATDNTSEHELHMSAYAVGQKSLVMATIRQLPKPYTQSLYKVNIANSDWKYVGSGFDFLPAE
jgi:hypothetical protein